MTIFSTIQQTWRESTELRRQAAIANLLMAVSGTIQLGLGGFGWFYPWGTVLRKATALGMALFALFLWRQVVCLERVSRRGALMGYLANNCDHLIERLNRLDLETVWIREFDLSDPATADNLLLPSRHLINQIRENICHSRSLLKKYGET